MFSILQEKTPTTELKNPLLAKKNCLLLRLEIEGQFFFPNTVFTKLSEPLVWIHFKSLYGRYLKSKEKDS